MKKFIFESKLETPKKTPIEQWFLEPINAFIGRSTTSGIVLFISAIAALIFANSPWHETYHAMWGHKFSIGYDNFIISKDLHHWINDGLMSIFFFVVGLELKREIIAGELRNPKAAVLPIIAALCGMLFPALVYFFFNTSGEASNGWGIPMATDIAFALGVLYMLGNRVPLSLKIFLTVLAIADDLGAVVVIAIFYTSNINYDSLLVGAAFFAVLLASNLSGVRNPVWYGLIGITGLWTAFLMSGVHATIAAVIAAFTIPANVKISEIYFIDRLGSLLDKFKKADPNGLPTVTTEQFHILDEVRRTARQALTPLQRLEHSMHPFVAFFVMPIFAFSNAGVTLSNDAVHALLSPVAIGVFFGLLLGKVIGVFGIPYILIRLKWAHMPKGMTRRDLLAAGFLAAIGFTMSLFIAGLAFKDPVHINEAKLGILCASILAGIIGYILLSMRKKPKTLDEMLETPH